MDKYGSIKHDFLEICIKYDPLEDDMKFVWETAGRNRQSVGAAFEPHPQAPQSFTAGVERKEQRKLWQHQALRNDGADFAELADKVVCCTGLRG